MILLILILNSININNNNLEWQEHSFFNMQSSQTNLIHSLSFIVSTACSSRINSEQFFTSESFVHSTHIA